MLEHTPDVLMVLFQNDHSEDLSLPILTKSSHLLYETIQTKTKTR